MNQEKIGRFISILRKEKNMTQEELAEKIGVTDRAISKWENGRGMPDLSLMQPLCEELGITINELLSGEKIKRENYQQKLEENIVNKIDYTRKKIDGANKKFKVLSLVMLFIVILITLFCIDVSRMRNNKPIFFSTWGYKYAPAIDLHEEEIEIAITDYLINKIDSEPKHYNDEKGFVSFRTYLIEENNKKLHNIYAWVLMEKYYKEEDIKKDSTFSIPYKFVVEFIDDEYVVTDSRTPRDGSYYEDDMKNIFPKSARDDMKDVYEDGTIERLKLDINRQKELYFSR